MFNALVLRQQDDVLSAAIETLEESQLPAGEVLVDVDYSSLNYKDGLAITGSGKIIRDFPMVPGIDFAGTVLDSQDKRYATGDAVILTGWGVGERHWGGIAEKARVKADWLVPMPKGFTAKQAMIVGTAGLTAMLCINALVDAGLTPQSGEILVTGASGGVGSVAVTLLSQMGFSVVAVTGRQAKNGDWLQSLGASRVIERDELSQSAKPLEKSQWAGVVDTVGGKILAKALAQLNYGGVAVICGLAGGMDLPTTVMPFILRGVTLVGIDSVMCPFEKRIAAWKAIMQHLPHTFYEQAGKEITLEQVPEAAQAIIQGQITGRTLIKL